MFAAPVPRNTPRPVEDALRWQLDRVGSTAWEGWSLKFQCLAYGHTTDPGPTAAADVYGWLVRHGLVETTAPPPRGKLVWYAAEGRVTVMSSLSDGRVVGPGVLASVGVTHYLSPAGYLGWSDPLFPYAR